MNRGWTAVNDGAADGDVQLRRRHRAPARNSHHTPGWCRASPAVVVGRRHNGEVQSFCEGNDRDSVTRCLSDAARGSVGQLDPGDANEAGGFGERNAQNVAGKRQEQYRRRRTAVRCYRSTLPIGGSDAHAHRIYANQYWMLVAISKLDAGE